ncbi:sam dependent methyltransferase [Apodospora peruviana]|uniref:Sam dependent methyltransferase n=1 Tax=Apodospora peruviana TaxID=516989 RepID=A0AAE0MF56_9PEZI|nr:sam dependent methyltransferase [Apodospora peruviana]
MASYPLPSHLDGDARRLNLQHQAFRLILNEKLLLTPVVPADFSGRVLDIGTGTGLWAAEFAASHPAASAVVGVDLFQPDLPSPPSPPLPNLSFHILDIESNNWQPPFLQEEESFDIIHGRMVLFHMRDPLALLRKCFALLKPGGYLEFQEMEHPYRTDDDLKDSPTVRFSRLRLEAASKCGFDRSIAGRLAELLCEAGFELDDDGTCNECGVHDYKFPIGSWMEELRMKLVGEKYLECLRLGMVGFSKRVMMEGLGWTEEQVIKACEEVREDLGKGRVYAPVRVAVARKPSVAAAAVTG